MKLFLFCFFMAVGLLSEQSHGGGAFRKRDVTPQGEPATRASPGSLTSGNPSSSAPVVAKTDRQILVAFKQPLDQTARQSLFAKHGLKEIEKVGSTDLYLTELPAGVTESQVKKVIEQISAEVSVKYAERNIVLKTFTQPTIEN